MDEADEPRLQARRLVPLLLDHREQGTVHSAYNANLKPISQSTRFSYSAVVRFLVAQASVTEKYIGILFHT